MIVATWKVLRLNESRELNGCYEPHSRSSDAQARRASLADNRANMAILLTGSNESI